MKKLKASLIKIDKNKFKEYLANITIHIIFSYNLFRIPVNIEGRVPLHHMGFCAQQHL